MTEKQKAYIRNTICSLCLSFDRKLVYIEKAKLTMLKNIIQISKAEKICWECDSVIRKMISFQNRALKAQTALSKIYKTLESTTTFEVQCLSRLVKTEVHSGSIEPAHADTELSSKMLKTEIKIEPMEEVYDDEGESTDTAVDEYEELRNPEIKIENIDPLLVENNNISSDQTEDQILVSKDKTKPSNNVSQHLKLQECTDLDPFEQELKKPIEEKYQEFWRDRMKITFLPEENIKKKPTAGGQSAERDRAVVTCEIARAGANLTTLNLSSITCNAETITEEEMLEVLEKRRMEKYYLSRKFKCEKCILTFHTKQALGNHMWKHTEKHGPFSCQVCKLRFESLEEAEWHKKTTHYTRYRCRECGDYKRDAYSMWIHCQYKHVIKSRACETCGVTVMTNYLMSVHKSQNHKQKPTCDLCGLFFGDYEALKDHMQSHDDIPEIACPVCAGKFKGAWVLYEHVRKMHRKSQYVSLLKCTECNIDFDTYPQYRDHSLKTQKHDGNNETSCACPQCDERMAAPAMRAHLAATHPATPAPRCDLCDKTFASELRLKKHVRLVHHKKPRQRSHVCEYCGKGFYDKPILLQHLNIHLGRRPYVCTFCDATFSFASSLFTHKKLKHVKNKNKKTPATVTKKKQTRATTTSTE